MCINVLIYKDLASILRVGERVKCVFLALLDWASDVEETTSGCGKVGIEKDHIELFSNMSNDCIHI